MLTPTGVTVADYWNAIKAGNRTHVRITFLESGIVLDDHDVYLSTGVNVTDMLNGDIDLVFGKTVCKQMTTALINSTSLDGLKWTDEFTLEFGVEIGNPAVTNWVTVGTFSGEEPNSIVSADIIEFTAYDRMKRFDVIADEFLTTITYPMTVQDIYDALCAFVGMSNDAGDELPNIMSRSFTTAPAEMEGYTLKDILAWIAQANGCYAKINASGNVQLIWFSDNTSYAVTGDEEFNVEAGDINPGLIWNEADLLLWDEIDQMTWNDVDGNFVPKVDRLVVKQVQSDMDISYPSVFDGENTYMIVGNPFLSIGSQADIDDYIAPLFNRLNKIVNYWILNVDCVGNWLVEAGDIITVDVRDTSVSCPIFVKTMKWNGATNDNYETTGQKKRAVYSNEADKQKVMNSREIKLIVNGKYYEVQSGIVIDENGVEISGNQYLMLQAGHIYDKWYYDAEGLTFEGHAIVSDEPVEGQYVTFGINPFTGETIPNTNGGIYPQFNNDANYLNILLKAWKKRNDGKLDDPYLHVDAVSTYKSGEYSDTGNQICLYTDKINGAVTGRIGTESNYWRDIYVESLYYVFIEQVSSRKLKENIKELPERGEAIDKLVPVSFNYKSDKRKKPVYGLIYEDTVEVMPDICSHPDGKEEIEDTSKGINYMAIIPILLKEVQSLRKRVAELEKQQKKG